MDPKIMVMPKTTKNSSLLPYKSIDLNSMKPSEKGHIPRPLEKLQKKQLSVANLSKSCAKIIKQIHSINTSEKSENKPNRIFQKKSTKRRPASAILQRSH